MPTMSGTVTCVANTRTANQLSGKAFEFLPYDAYVQIYAITSAAPVTSRFSADQDIVIDDETVNYVGTTIDTGAHLLADEEISAGSRLNLSFLSTGTPTVLWVINVTPLE